MSRNKQDCSTKCHLTLFLHLFNVRIVSNQNITSKYGIGVLYRSTAVLRYVLEDTAVIPMLTKQNTTKHNTLFMLCGYVGTEMHQLAVHCAETISSTKPKKQNTLKGVGTKSIKPCC
jgi:hypothetical protein